MWKKALTLLVVAVVLVGVVAGCGSRKEEPVVEETSRMDKPQVATAVDPACGMNVAMTEDAITYEYEGETYYFCSADCKADFVADPGKYMEKMHEEMEEHQEGMHGEGEHGGM